MVMSREAASDAFENERATRSWSYSTSRMPSNPQRGQVYSSSPWAYRAEHRTQMRPVTFGSGGVTPSPPHRARSRRVLHGEREAADTVEGMERGSHGGRRGHEADLPDSLGAERSVRLGILDKDDLHLGHVPGAEDARVADPEARGHSVHADHLLAQGVAETHVDRALDLPLAEPRVYGASHVVRGDDLRHAARLVHDHDLSGEAEGRVQLHRLARRRLVSELRGVVLEPLADVDRSNEIAERPSGVQIGAQLSGGVDDGAPAEERGARARGLPHRHRETRIHTRRERGRRKRGDLAGALDE